MCLAGSISHTTYDVRALADGWMRDMGCKKSSISSAACTEAVEPMLGLSPRDGSDGHDVDCEGQGGFLG